ncbi:MAG: hypothetical protein KGI80_03090 [Verrucomicrobiota bacterium]|nr:hypothetical protein [Verrucomicrobiota bacterium]
MSQCVAGYAKSYREIWNKVLRPIAAPTSESVVTVEELGRAIVGKSRLNHARIAKIAVSMPKKLKQEVADWISQNEPASMSKAKALMLLEAQTGQIADTLPGDDPWCANIAAFVMGCTGRSKEELLAITEGDRDVEWRNAALSGAAEARAVRGAGEQELVSLIARMEDIESAIDSSDRAWRTVLVKMAVRGAKQAELFAVVGRLTEGGWVFREEVLHDIVKEMAAGGVKSEELLAITAEMRTDTEWYDWALSTVAEVMAAEGAGPEDLLAIVRRMRDPEQRHFALSSIAEVMAKNGAEQKELLAIIMEKIKEAELYDTWGYGDPQAIVATDLPQENLLAFIKKRYREIWLGSDRPLCYVVQAMAVRGAGEAELFALIDEIQDPKEHDWAVGNVAVALAARGVKWETLLAIIERIGDPRWRDGVLRDVAVALVTRGAKLEELLVIIENMRVDAWWPSRDDAWKNIAEAMAVRGAGSEELLAVMGKLQNSSGWDYPLRWIVGPMVANGAKSEEILTVLTL